MRRLSNILRHLTAISLIAGLSVGICVYANPYSLHRVSIVSYDEFDTPANADGVVTLPTDELDFRLPIISLDKTTQQKLQDLVERESDGSTLSQVQVATAFVRHHLNATDTTKPSPADSDLPQLISDGLNLYCLCSDHALLLNEALQSIGLTSRVVWLEGHVANEVFDEQTSQWIYVDAHQNVLARSDSKQPLSIARLIQRLEHEEPVEFDVVTDTVSGSHVLQYTHQDTTQRLWYRNVLLNGECSTLTGSMLQSPSRWTHLMRSHSRPQMLVLHTDYDTSPGRRLEPFKPRKAVLAALAMIACFYLGVWLLYGWRRNDDAHADSCKPGEIHDTA